ncbi:S8 family serine peptidase [Saliphagus sp. GCM10025334]
MVDGPRDGWSVFAVLMAAVMVLVVFTPVGAAGSPQTQVTDAATETNDTVQRATFTTGVAPIENDLESAEGTVDVILRLEELETRTVAQSGNAQTALKTHARNTQVPVERTLDATAGVEVEESFWITNAMLVTVDTDEMPIERLARLEGVTRVHANYEVHQPEPVRERSVSADELGTEATTAEIQSTYGLDQINATEVWAEYGTRGEGVKVAVLDTGVDPDHPDIEIAPENWAEFDIYGNPVEGSEPYDSGSHGTHVSGTIVGGDASGEHIGVAPNATLMHGLVLSGGSGSLAQIIGGMEWAVQEDADIISMSLGSQRYESEYIDPIRNAEAAGTIVISAAGNDGPGTSGSPANVYDGMAIGASDANEDITYFSGGETIVTADAWANPPSDWPDEYVVPDVAAPGASVTSAVPGGGYSSKSGTSMATPHVSGVVALMLSSGGDLDPATISETLETTAWKPDGEPAGQDTRYGHGIVDANAATAAVALESGVTGTVTDAAGEPVAEATVAIEGGLETTTNAMGEYELRANPGAHTLTVEKFGYQTVADSVTVDDGAFTERSLTLDPALEATLLDGQPDKLEGGESISTVVTVANAEDVVVDLDGGYDATAATLEINGGEHDFGQPAELADDGEVTVTVSTAAGTAGELSLVQTYSNSTDETTITTGPTTVYEELQRVAVVAEGVYGSAVGDVLETRLTKPTAATVVTVDEVVDEVETYDAIVVQSVGDQNLWDFATATNTADVGVVYLDQWGSDANGIPKYAALTGDPGHTAESYDNGVPVYYDVQNDHTILDGWTVGDQIDVHANPIGDFTWFDETSFTILAEVRAQDGTGGPALAIDEETNTVFASSLGRNQYIGNDDYTAEADEVLANAVSYAAAEAASPNETAFYGSATIAGEPAPEGTPVTAAVDGNVLASTEVGPNGVYATHANPLTLESSDAGDGSAVTFTVGYWDAEETAVWQNQAVQEQSLAVPGGELTGTITDATHEAVVSDATVELVRDGTVVASTTTATDGTYAFTEVTPQAYTLSVSAPGFETATTDVTLESGGAQTANVSLAGDASLSGTVIENGTEAPLESASLTLEGPSGTYETTSNATGWYAFEEVPGTGEYTLTAETANHTQTTTSVTLAEGDDGTADVALTHADALFLITDVDAPTYVETDSSLEVATTIENVGATGATESVTLVISDTLVESTELSLEAGSNATTTLTWDTTDVDPASYAGSVETDDDQHTFEFRVVAAEAPPPIVGDSPPQDLTGDGRYEDLTGDGALTITDVQTLYHHRDSDVVQDHANAFDFTDSGAVGIADVQALYTLVTDE